ncbi:hypothetical protein H5410_020439 [Solanum commersonii]|uniref:Uncharacterized protein n=1 Tax=Solanum commersonii TaxID=4109 RepID=A0A9J5ZE59_SOLCO|nr:hypothetical protein H5410_020439 [Solanum commersonii]
MEIFICTLICCCLNKDISFPCLQAIQLMGNFPFKKSLPSHHIVNAATPERLRRLYNILTICYLQTLVDVSQIYNHYAWVGIS